jgi:alpha-2-macroglobulin
VSAGRRQFSREPQNSVLVAGIPRAKSHQSLMPKISRVILALAVLVSCLPGAKAPSVTPTRTLELGTEGKARTSSDPFGVVFSSPHGQVSDPSEVSIVFNRPMRELELAGQEAKSPVALVVKGGAAPKGSWRWLGTQAISFIPEGHLPRATEYAVTIPKGTRSLAGDVLPEAHTFEFKTELPVLEAIAVHNKDESERPLPTSQFDVHFNQVIESRVLERALVLSAASVDEPKKERSLAFTVARIRNDVAGAPAAVPYSEQSDFRVTPSAPLPLASRIRLHSLDSLRGTEGPLPAGKEEERVFETYGPLLANDIRCSRDTDKSPCDPRGGAGIAFSNPVVMPDAKDFIKLDPPLPLNWSKEKDTAQSLWLPARLRPAQSLKVTVLPGLRDIYGQVLTKEKSFTIAVGDERPYFTVGAEGTHFEAKRPRATRQVPIGTMNLSKFELGTLALTEEALAKVLATEGYREERYEKLKSLGLKLEAVAPQGPRNRVAVRTVAMDDVLSASNGRGALALTVRAATGGDERSLRTDIRLFSVSDLAITARMSRFGSLVWVSRLSDGKFIADASVVIRNAEGAVRYSGKTDANGMLSIAAASYQPVDANGSLNAGDLIIARLEADWTYHRVSEPLDGWRLGGSVSVDVSGRQSPYGMVITDRGVYRPGETVHIKSYFREPMPKGSATPVGRNLVVTAADRAGNVVFEKKELKLGAFGELTLDIPIPATAPMGSLSITAAVDGKSESEAGAARATVLLAAYKASEFKVAVEADKPSYIRGEAGAFTVRGDFLFGAPMSGAGVSYEIVRHPSFFTPPGMDAYTFGDSTYSSELRDANAHSGRMINGKSVLSNKGSLSVPVPASGTPQTGAEMVSLEAEVQDFTRQTVNAQSQFVVHPGSFYLGIQGDDRFVQAGSLYKAKVLATSPAGVVRSGAKVRVDLIRRSYATSIEDSGDNRGRSESRPVDQIVRSCELVTAAQVVSCDLQVAEAAYYIVRATSNDERKNPIATSTYLYATSESAEPGNSMMSWSELSRNALELVADKASYDVGQTARVLVKSPFKEADALVTIERAGVYEQRRVHVSGPMPVIPVPITETLRPNAFISVQLTRGRSKEAVEGKPDLTGPAFRLGYLELPVSAESKRLAVKLSPSKRDLSPGESLSIDVATLEKSGKGVATDVTLYVVDEGVLMLTGYKTPDPIPVFGAARALNVASYESRENLGHLLRVRAGPGSDKGEEGGGGGAEASVRSDFRATAHFSSVRTNSEGKASVQVKLPDGLTAYRVMAVAAAADDRFGYAETQLTTSKPLMARPALPRFLRAGDFVRAGVVVTTKGLPETTVVVSLDAKGVKLEGPREQSVVVPASGSIEVQWPVRAESIGDVKFKWSVKGSTGKDDVEVTRQVQAPVAPETVAVYGETEDAAAEKLGALTRARADFGGIDLRVSTTALVGLESSMEALMQYPYGCTEQLTSRLVPYVIMQDFAKLYGFSLEKGGAKNVDEALAKILQNQRPTGGFGYWSDSPSVDPWLTSYALWGLSIAKAHGRNVPDQALADATQFVRRSLANLLLSNDYDSARAAFSLDVLADRGEFDAGYASKLLDNRAKLPLFARAHLAHALAVAKQRPKDAAALMSDLEQHVRITTTGAILTSNADDKYGDLLDSDARTTALVLRALIALDPKHPMAARFARGLLGMRTHGAWRSTIENATSLVALEEYRRAQEKTGTAINARVFFGETFLEEFSFKENSVQSRTANVPMSRVLSAGGDGSALSFQLLGSGKAFYEARVKYAPKELPTASLDRGFYVEKWVREVAPENLQAALRSLPQSSSKVIEAGSMVLVDLVLVTTSPRQQVVLDDPLPAGFEPIQSSFATSGSAASRVDSSRDDSDDDSAESEDASPAFRSSWFHREYRDDRVLTFVEHMAAGAYHYRYLARASSLGTFVVPPARAECMYEPETFGRTAAATIEIRKR